jgi:molybdopterin converting factor small subunit
VTVEFFAQAREAAGCAAETVDLGADATLLTLARTLVEKHGPRMAQLLLEPGGELSRHVLFTVGDVQVSGAATLADGDRVTIVPPISGG